MLRQREDSYLWWSTQEQASGVGSGGALEVCMVLLGTGPLAVVERLLQPAHVVGDGWPQRAAPGEVGVGQQGRGAGLVLGARRQQGVRGPGEDGRARVEVAASGAVPRLRGLAGPLHSVGRRGGGGRGRGGTEGEGTRKGGEDGAWWESHSSLTRWGVQLASAVPLLPVSVREEECEEREAFWEVSGMPEELTPFSVREPEREMHRWTDR